MMKHTFTKTVAFVLLVSTIGIVWGGRSANAPVRAQDDLPVVANLGILEHSSYLGVYSSSVWLDNSENLYLALTDLNPVTQEIEPEMAESWLVSDDGLTWTFNLRRDVMWVTYDPMTYTTQAIRPVVAGDFSYTLRIHCPTIITGCVEWLPYAGNERLHTDKYTDTTIGVTALDDYTLKIELASPISYFLAYTSLFEFHAFPMEASQDLDYRNLPGQMMMNGPYLLSRRPSGRDTGNWEFVRNELLPEDLWHGGNIDIVQMFVSDTSETVFMGYQGNEYDISPVPLDQIAQVKADSEFEKEIFEIKNYATAFITFNPFYAPFDDVRVRQAFNAIMDREALREYLNADFLEPSTQFAPIQIPYAPNNADQIRNGFDPEYARSQLAAAGYPNCEGLPRVKFYAENYILGRTQVFEFVIQSAIQHLGCNEENFYIETMPPPITNEIPPITETEYRWRFGAWFEWRHPIYPDANNYYEPFYCPEYSAFSLESGSVCNNINTLIDAAKIERDPTTRQATYNALEVTLFGPEGEMPIIPLFWATDVVLIKPWFTGPFETDALTGGRHWDAYYIDQAQKSAAN